MLTVDVQPQTPCCRNRHAEIDLQYIEIEAHLSKIPHDLDVAPDLDDRLTGCQPHPLAGNIAQIEQ